MKIMDTYEFRNDEEVNRLRNIGKDTIYIKDKNGKRVSYSKEKVVDAILKLVKDKKVRKGIRVKNNPDNYLTYIFDYAVKDDEIITKYSYQIKVAKDSIKENIKYINRLNAAVSASESIRTVNHLKVAALMGGTILLASSVVYGFLFGDDDSYKYMPEPPAIEQDVESQQISTSLSR